MRARRCSGTGRRNAGFTSAAKPWLAVNPNYTEVNATQELADPNSVYRYYARMIALRRTSPALIYGDYKDLDPANAEVFCYTRTLGREQYLVVLNFSEKAKEYELPEGMEAGQLLLSNEPAGKGGAGGSGGATLHLKGWEARVYKGR